MSENSILQAKNIAENIYYRPFTIFGYDPTCTNSASGQIVYDDNASTYDLSQATTNEDIAVTSSDNSDTQSITIKGLNSSLVEVQETLTLTGQTPVLGTVQFYRINEVINNSSTAFAGKIFICKYPYASGVTAGVPSATDFQTNVRVHISIGFNRLTQGLFTVPAGYRAYAQVLTGSYSSTSATAIYLRSKTHNTTAWNVEETVVAYATGTTTAIYQFPVALVFPAGTDLSLFYITGSASQKVHAECELLLEKI